MAARLAPRPMRRTVRFLTKNGKKIKLKPGDVIVWSPDRQSISFGRNNDDGGNRIFFADSEGDVGPKDDRHHLKITDYNQFFWLADLIAALHGFDVQVENGRLMTFVAKKR